LFFRSWLLLTVPVAMYVIFRLLIGEEEAYLREAFGEAYVAYGKGVNLAFPRLWKLRSAFWYPTPTGQVAERVYAVTTGDASMFIYNGSCPGCWLWRRKEHHDGICQAGSLLGQVGQSI
jgi:hypothetical protein